MPTAATTNANSNRSLISKQGAADLSTLTQLARGPAHGGHFSRHHGGLHPRVEVLPEGLLRGPKAIRSFFVKLFEEFAKPGTSFEMLRQEVDGDTAYIVWRAETVRPDHHTHKRN
jgi:hypothetical protein